MKKQYTITFVLFLLLISAALAADENMLKSPDGVISIELNVTGGVADYSLSYKGNPVLKNCSLGLVREDADFSSGLNLISISKEEIVTDNYKLYYGKKSNSSYRGNRKVFHLENKEKKKLDIIFQLSNDGAAFRYYFPEDDDSGEKVITAELTNFNFDENTQAWIQPMSAAKSGWNSVNPSYEEHYYSEIEIKKIPKSDPGCVFPALFKSGNYWIALSETAPDRNYCGCRLMHDSLSTSFKIGFPQKQEFIFGGPLLPQSKLPWSTPWRIITIGDNLGTIVESTLGTDLAKPSVISDASYVKPGRSAWSWALMKDDSTIYSVQKRFIDYASEMKWEYSLIDADWDRKIGYEKLGELCAYAKSKNVKINVWYNSAGDWNTTPYTPRDKLLTKELRDAEFSKLKELGVSGVKVDFFGGDGQSVMTYYQDIFEDAAKYGLLVNCHGSTLLRGWQRTYPNLMTMEAIKGFEYVTFEQGNADKQAEHCTIIPFTRNLFDPMDFTPVCFSEVPGMKRKTSNAFELALSVLFLSGIQHFVEIPEGMAKVPAEVKEVMREVPVAWDETKFIDAYPGKYVVIARRKNDKWYVAGINYGQEKEIKLNPDFIDNASKGLLITDGENNRTFKIEKTSINSLNESKLVLKDSGGFLLVINK